MLAEHFHIDKEIVCKIITAELRKKKAWVRFLQPTLMEEQQEERVDIENLLKMCNNKTVISDES